VQCFPDLPPHLVCAGKVEAVACLALGRQALSVDLTGKVMDRLFIDPLRKAPGGSAEDA
jgi:hypothetical protein